MRRSVVAVLILGSTTILSGGQTRPTAPAAKSLFTVVEATIPEMRDAMDQRRTSSREIVLQYLTRIAMYEDELNAAITVNPKALEEADARDRERAQGRVRGPLHGIPIALISSRRRQTPQFFRTAAFHGSAVTARYS
jgi:amidase